MTSKLTIGLAAALALYAGTAAVAAEKLTIGMLNGASSFIPLIADEKGYFRAEGLDAEFVVFDAGAKMIPSLGTGQLMVGIGAASSALYNAAGRGLELKIVSSALRNSPGVGQSLLVRSDLMSEGKVARIADLKGRKIAVTAMASSDAAALDQAMRTAGLTIDDVDPLYIGFPDQVNALTNKAVDAALTGEPFATLASRRGVAKSLVLVGDYYPNQETAVVVFGESIIRRKDDVGARFMIAFIKAAKDYVSAQKGGYLAGSEGDAIVAILAKRSSIKDPALIKEMRAFGADTNGGINISSLQSDFEFFKRRNQIEGKASVEATVDASYSAAAVRELAARK